MTEFSAPTGKRSPAREDHPNESDPDCAQRSPTVANRLRSLEQNLTLFRRASTPCSRFALSVRVSLPLMLAVVGILPLVIWLADLLPPLAGMA
jgi:hypothetical protein